VVVDGEVLGMQDERRRVQEVTVRSPESDATLAVVPWMPVAAAWWGTFFGGHSYSEVLDGGDHDRPG
jgi:hypothetical protein